MNQDVKAGWLKKLRSKRFKQGRRFLKKTAADGKPEYCCMGVLCQLAVSKKIIKRPTKLGTVYEFGSHGARGVLPEEVVSWAGLPGNNPTVDSESLSEWNDHRGRTFSEIADLIERHL